MIISIISCKFSSPYAAALISLDVETREFLRYWIENIYTEHAINRHISKHISIVSQHNLVMECCVTNQLIKKLRRFDACEHEYCNYEFNDSTCFNPNPKTSEIMAIVT